MVLWHVSYDLGLVENQFLWQIPLALAFFFGLAYSLLDDVVEWIEEKWEELREFLGCEEEESVFDKVVAVVESWLDTKVTRWTEVFSGLFALFVFKLIAGLIAVLVVGLLSLYVWVGREFHQVSVFLMTIEDFFVVAVGLVGFCIRLWDENFLLLWNLLADASAALLVIVLIQKFAWGLRELFEGKNSSGILRAMRWILFTIVIAACLSFYFLEGRLLVDICYALGSYFKFWIPLYYNCGGRAFENLGLVLTWLQSFITSYKTPGYIWMLGWSLALSSWDTIFNGLICFFAGACFIAEGLVGISYLLREAVVLNQNYRAYVTNTGFIIHGLLAWFLCLGNLFLQNRLKKESEKNGGNRQTN